MSSAVYFCNPGHLDLRALTVMGLNAKPNSGNPIGFFGTGFKYALAVCARIGADVKIRTNNRWYVLDKEYSDFRGKEFFMLMLRDLHTGEVTHNLPFTTELGKNWETWTVVRELGSNARDEGGDFYIEPCEDDTTIIVEHDDIFDLAATRNSVFLDEPKLDCSDDPRPNVTIHDVKTGAIFYRGIRVAKLLNNTATSMYTYNIIANTRLTEDRTLLSSHGALMEIGEAIAKCNDPQIIEKCIRVENQGEGKKLESEIIFGGYLNSQECKIFLNCVESCIDRKIKVHKNVMDFYLKTMPKPVPKRVENDDYEAMLHESLKLLKVMGINLSKDCVEIVESIPNHNAFAIADINRDMISVAEMTFAQGQDFVNATMLEEALHLNERLSDCSQEMQERLCEVAVHLAEMLQRRGR